MKEPYIIKINKPIEDNIKGKLRKIFQTQIGEEPVVLLPTDCEVIPQIIRCKDCRFSVMTAQGDCKYCQYLVNEFGITDAAYFSGDDFCSHAERRQDD